MQTKKSPTLCQIQGVKCQEGGRSETKEPLHATSKMIKDAHSSYKFASSYPHQRRICSYTTLTPIKITHPLFSPLLFSLLSSPFLLYIIIITTVSTCIRWMNAVCRRRRVYSISGSD